MKIMLNQVLEKKESPRISWQKTPEFLLKRFEILKIIKLPESVLMCWKRFVIIWTAALVTCSVRRRVNDFKL